MAGKYDFDRINLLTVSVSLLLFLIFLLLMLGKYVFVSFNLQIYWCFAFEHRNKTDLSFRAILNQLILVKLRHSMHTKLKEEKGKKKTFE